jgi:hypothetical protein
MEKEELKIEIEELNIFKKFEFPKSWKLLNAELNVNILYN